MKYLTFFLKLVCCFFIILFVIFAVLSKFHEFGFNKTVGWAWDLTQFIFPLLTIYFSVYLTFYVMKVKQNIIFLAVSIILILLSLVFVNNTLFFALFFLTSILLFITNCIYSIYLKFKSNKP